MITKQIVASHFIQITIKLIYLNDIEYDENIMSYLVNKVIIVKRC